VGLALLLYGTYFSHPPYGGTGIIAASVGALCWCGNTTNATTEVNGYFGIESE